MKNDIVIPSEIQSLEKYYQKILPTGSRVICPQNVSELSDADYMILIRKADEVSLSEMLVYNGWAMGGSLLPDTPVGALREFHEVKDGALDQSGVFHSWKLLHGGITLNLLVTCNPQYFDDFTRATFLARKLSLTNKASRVILFQAIAMNVWPSLQDEPVSSTKKGKTFYKKVDWRSIIDKYPLTTHNPILRRNSPGNR